MESPKEIKQVNQPKKKEMKHLSKLMDAPTKRTEQFNVLLSKVEKSMVEEMAEFYAAKLNELAIKTDDLDRRGEAE